MSSRPTSRGSLARLIVVLVPVFGVVSTATVLTVLAGDPDTAPRPASSAVNPALDPMTEAGQRALSARFGRHHTPSDVLIPDQSIPLRFSHRVHLELLECKDCHASVLKSVRSADVNLPDEATCLDCHDIKEGMTPQGSDPPARCDTCHPGFAPEWLPDADKSDTSQVKVHPKRVVFPAPHIKFNHRIHLQKGVGCETCHGDMTKQELATRDNSLPLMGTCIGCHDGKAAPDECRTCHETLPDGRIDTTIGHQQLAPAGWYHDDAHDADWLKTHRNSAQLGDDYCANCHTAKECVDCHNGVKKPLKVHPNNWILQHPSAARKNTPDCQSCHRSQTFCVDCHQQTKLVWEQPNRPAANLRFHPEGWVDSPLNQRGPNHHSFEAQRNIRACASCHTEETCVSCHATFGRSGLNVNPHPPGFRGGACASMRSRNDRVCTKCHEPGSPRLRCQ